MIRQHVLVRIALWGAMTLSLGGFSLPAAAESAPGKVEHPVQRVAVVPLVPRPLTAPRPGPAPMPTVGRHRDALPDASMAVADPVSPESRAHLEALIREFRQR